jgi:hypothetical protein
LAHVGFPLPLLIIYIVIGKTRWPEFRQWFFLLFWPEGIAFITGTQTLWNLGGKKGDLAIAPCLFLAMRPPSCHGNEFYLSCMGRFAYPFHARIFETVAVEGVLAS